MCVLLFCTKDFGFVCDSLGDVNIGMLAKSIYFFIISLAKSHTHSFSKRYHSYTGVYGLVVRVSTS